MMRKHAWSARAIGGAAVMALALLGAGAAIGAESSAARTWLGVYTQALTDELRDGIGYKGDGVLVTRVVPGSPAEGAGLKKGDVIVSLDSRAATAPEDLTRLVRAAHPGQAVSIQVVRDGERKSLTARLGSRDEQELEPSTPSEREEGPSEPMPPPGEVHEFNFEDHMPQGIEMLRFMGRGRLGVRVESLNPDLGGYFGIPDGKGALVIEVLKDTPAERAGLKAGDVITRVGDRTVYDSEDLVNALRREEGKVALGVVRKGAKRSIEAELSSRSQTFRMPRGQGLMGLRDDDLRRYRELRERGDAKGTEDLRKQMQELREELRQLRQQLEEMHRN